NIIGVKDSSGDAKNLAAYRDAVPRWSVFAGSGSLLYAALELGCDGGILAVACFAGALCAQVFAAFRAGDRAGAGKLQERRAPLEGVNVIAVRPRARVAVWLVAHYDSKGQPLSMATRLVAAALAILGGLELLALAVRALLGPLHAGMPDVLVGAAGVAGILLLAANGVTNHSPGAVDNAAGVVAVLATLDALPPEAGVGVLLPDAEEYGLLGARALGRG